LSCEVCVSLIVFIDIEIITIDVVTTSIAAISSVSRTIIDKEQLLANDTLRITLIAVWALTDASIVQEDKRALALETTSGFRRRAFFTSWIAANASFVVSCVTSWTL
jgi:hypothetical protein